MIGTALGVVAAPAVAWMMAAPTGPHDLFGLSITCAVVGLLFGSFFGGWVGMSLTRQAVVAPATGPADGSFVLAVAAGDARDRANDILHRFGGHDPMPTATALHNATA